MTPYFEQNNVTLYQGDAREVLRALPDSSVNCCVTSPPYYGLRDYGCDGQIGLEQTPAEYVAEMVGVMREVRRVLADDGTLWLNIGDSYCANKNGNKDTLSSTLTTRADGTRKRDQTCTGRLGGNFLPGQKHADVSNAPNRGKIDGLKPKDLIGVPWMLAFALRDDGWYLRQDIIWHKPNPMPESVADRCTKAHEYIFLLSKSERYFYDSEAIKQRSVTNDPRRPYTSQGAWAMDGRPEEQRHGGEPRSFKGSKFFTGKTAEHQLGRASMKPRKTKVPGGWDTKEVSHGTIHREGRTEAEYVELDEITEANKRSVWTVPTKPYKAAHFATFPPGLIEPCIKAGVAMGGVCLDPFFGAGTTGLVCQQQHVRCIGVELNPAYCEIAKKRLAQGVLFGASA